MTTALDVSAAMTMARSQPLRPPSPTSNATAATKAAKQFESVFISQFLGQMFESVPTDGPFGGGEGEEMFRSLMVDEFKKKIEAQGGFGLAAPVARHLLQLQEARS